MGMSLTPGANLGIAAKRISVTIGWDLEAEGVDASAFLCGTSGTVLSDDHFVFYNASRSPDGSVGFTPGAGASLEMRQRFDIDLDKVAALVEKIDICLTIHEGIERGVNFESLRKVALRVMDLDGGDELARFDVPVPGMRETAAILGSVYRRNGQWKFRAVGQGFIGGLAPLARHYGVDVAEEEAASAPPSPPPAAPAAPVNLTKVTLEKQGQSVSLEKKNDAGFGEILFNLNWNQRPEKKGGFLGGILGGSKGIDLDLGCLWELESGDKGAVQALGESWGAYRQEPYIQHAGDDRTGATSEGETIRINGDRLSKIRRTLVYAFIYQGVPNWAGADGVATVRIPGQPDIEVRLDNPTSGQGMCAIALIENDRGKLKVTKEERYFRSHPDMDKAYHWGLRWSAGSKD